MPVLTFQDCHYIRQGFLPGIPLTTRCFSQVSHDSSLLPVATIFYQPGWRYIRAVLVFRMVSAQAYAYDDLVLCRCVSVHDTNKRCSHYASCLSRSSWNSQLCGIVRWQPIFTAQASTLHRKTYISPVSRSEVWRNDWIVVISPVTTSTRSLVS